MNQELKDKWITALQSGEYEQANQELRNGDSYCCLGVLCDVVDSSAWYVSGGSDWNGAEGDLAMFEAGQVGDQPENAEIVAAFADLFKPDVTTEYENLHNKLISMNDADGADFTAIAEYIKEHLEVSQP